MTEDFTGGRNQREPELPSDSNSSLHGRILPGTRTSSLYGYSELGGQALF